MSTVPVPRPWRRSLRFSVRGLIVLVLVTGAGLGWLVRSARIQREAVAAIKNAGGNVTYDWKWSDGGLTNLTTLSLTFTQVTGPGLVHLKALTKLSTLDLGGTTLSDAGLAHLKAITSLSTLNLTIAHVTDAGVKNLQQALPSLTIDR